VRIVVLSRDLIIASRILAHATAAGDEAQLVSEPLALPPSETVDRLFVNWADRAPGWIEALNDWRGDERPSGPRIILYGPHADLEAHAAAQAAGLGPMLARSKLVADLPQLIAPTR
jgi:hypothetical protein